mgnify:CR=1 FL=1
MELFFNKHCINRDRNTYTISVSTQPMAQSQIGTLAGLEVATSKQTQFTLGLISLRDPETNEVIRPDHKIAKTLISNLKKNQPLKGWVLSDNPVIDQTTGEETGMYWAKLA